MRPNTATCISIGFWLLTTLASAAPLASLQDKSIDHHGNTVAQTNDRQITPSGFGSQRAVADEATVEYPPGYRTENWSIVQNDSVDRKGDSESKYSTDNEDHSDPNENNDKGRDKDGMAKHASRAEIRHAGQAELKNVGQAGSRASTSKIRLVKAVDGPDTWSVGYRASSPGNIVHGKNKDGAGTSIAERLWESAFPTDGSRSLVRASEDDGDTRSVERPLHPIKLSHKIPTFVQVDAEGGKTPPTARLPTRVEAESGHVKPIVRDLSTGKVDEEKSGNYLDLGFFEKEFKLTLWEPTPKVRKAIETSGEEPDYEKMKSAGLEKGDWSDRKERSLTWLQNQKQMEESANDQLPTKTQSIKKWNYNEGHRLGKLARKQGRSSIARYTGETGLYHEFKGVIRGLRKGDGVSRGSKHVSAFPLDYKELRRGFKAGWKEEDETIRRRQREQQ